MNVKAPYEVLADLLLRAAAAESADLDGTRASGSSKDLLILVGRLPAFRAQPTDHPTRRQSSMDIDAMRGVLREEIAEGTSAFAALAANAGLDADGAEMLAVLAAVESEPARLDLLGAIAGDANLARPTLGLLATLFADRPAALATLAPDGALIRAALVSITHDRAWARSEVRLHPLVVWALRHVPCADPDLPPGTRHIESDVATGDPLVIVPGPDRTRSIEVAARHALGDRFLAVALPADDRAWSAVVREATITGRGVIVACGDELPAAAQSWIERAEHLVWAIVSSCELPVGQLPERAWVEHPADDITARADEVAEAFGPDAVVPHRLTAEQIRLGARAVIGLHAHDATDVDATIAATAAVRRLASGDLDKLATRIRPRRRLDDLVLPPQQSDQVRQLLARYHHRNQVYGPWGFKPVPSAGVVALLAGPPGTGKTLTAEVVAGELGLDLYRVDLAALVSKYVGETEKNMERIFRAAEGGTMVLLFDEADAMFSKRSDVSDANDRYANVETSYLLQRIERYEGLVILTTNYANNIDQAFIRRIHVSIDFTAPDEDERRRLWDRAFPSDAPCAADDPIDVAWLAERFQLTGASIHASSLEAAFRAAAAGEPIAMAHVVRAVEAELRKQGRVTNAADFGRYADALTMSGDPTGGPLAPPARGRRR